MALDRQSIEKRDFPIGRRGYEPASVDAHLSSIAGEVEALQRAKPAAPGAPPASAPTQAPSAAASLSSIASTPVQAIVEAAESAAASIEREAREQAEQVERDAASESQRIRDEAIARSREHVGQVNEATSLMLQRVDAMEGELGTLIDSLRTGANRVSADLSLMTTSMGELYGAIGTPADRDRPSAPEPAAVAAVQEPKPQAPKQTAKPAPKQEKAPAGEEDVEGARLIALNMALNGQTREETAKYLAENFELSDPAGLLDEVYATVEG